MQERANHAYLSLDGSNVFATFEFFPLKHHSYFFKFPFMPPSQSSTHATHNSHPHNTYLLHMTEMDGNQDACVGTLEFHLLMGPHAADLPKVLDMFCLDL